MQAIVSQPIWVKERVLALFDLMHTFALAVNFRGCHFQNTAIELGTAQSETRQLIQGHKSRMEQVFADLLADARPGVAAEVTLPFEGALLMSQLYNSTEPIQKARNIVVQLL